MRNRVTTAVVQRPRTPRAAHELQAAGFRALRCRAGFDCAARTRAGGAVTGYTMAAGAVAGENALCRACGRANLRALSRIAERIAHERARCAADVGGAV